MILGIPHTAECCANCRHYRQHYIVDRTVDGSMYTECWCGHCTHPRIKDRRPNDYCERFEREERKEAEQ